MPTITCCNKEFNVSYTGSTKDTGSEYIKDVVTSFGNVDVVIPVPDKYCTVIDNYIKFVNGNQVLITSRERLLLCFQLNTLLIDEGYFRYCIQQTFNNWSYMCNMVYNDFNDDLQWSFFVYCPHDFIPKHLLDNNTFMKQWNNINQGTIIKVNNDNEVYYNNVETFNEHEQRCITTSHTVKITLNTNHTTNDVKVIGNKREIIYYANSNNIMSDISYVDDKREGLTMKWYDNSQHSLKFEGYYIDGNETGLRREWYDNEHNTLIYEGQYVNGREDGPWREWYDDDQQTTGSLRHTLKSEGKYVNGKLDGTWREWYDNDQHTLESEEYWLNDKKDGVWRHWYDNDQHTLLSERHYVDGKQDGVWREWYDNDQHTLKFEGYYVDGKPDGRWLGFDINGNITSDEQYVNGVIQQ